MTDTTYYRTPTGETFRITIEQDPDAASPRENDNATVIHTFDSQYFSPDDGESVRAGAGRASRSPSPLIPRDYIDPGHGVDMRHARKWVALFGKDPDVGILAIAGVERVLGGWAEGSLRITRDDDRAVGYVAITRESWDLCMGDSPLQGGAEHGTPSAAEVMAQDVAAYSRWAAGEYVGYIVEERLTWHAVAEGRPDSRKSYTEFSEVPDGSCWGIDDPDYALSEAKYLLPDGAVEVPRADVTDA